MALHCPECGFVNAEGANYCQKCGAFLGTPEPRGRDGHATYRVDDETGELEPVEIEDVVAARARRWSSAPAAGASARASRWTASG